MSERFEPTSLDKLEKQYDLVVIGSGSAGLTTAIKAAELGFIRSFWKKCLLLEGIPSGRFRDERG